MNSTGFNIGDRVKAKPDCNNAFTSGEGVIETICDDKMKIRLTNESCSSFSVGSSTTLANWQTDIELVNDSKIEGVIEVGDTVRQIKHLLPPESPLAIVTEADGSTIQHIHHSGESGGCTKDCFELVSKRDTRTIIDEIKPEEVKTEIGIGDRVRVTIGYSNASIGDEGIVRKINSCEEYGIEFDESFNGHNLNGKINNTNGYYVPKDNVEILDKGGKMEKPNTQLEKNACKQAKEKAIKDATDRKAECYEIDMKTYISTENKARDYRKDADKLGDTLGITDKDKKELFD